MTVADDTRYLRRALRAAAEGVGHTAPEPAVGVVAVRDGRARTAFRDAPDAEHPALAFGAVDTLYLTIEPPPDVANRIDAKRVVIGRDDPRFGGRGRRALARRIETTSFEDPSLAAQIEEVDEAYFFAARHGRPLVVLKSATTLDGRIATRGGESQWITGEAARRRGHALRDRLDAIVVGRKTVAADDPALTARVPKGRDPIRVVLDSTLAIDPAARLVATANATRTIVATTRRSSAEDRRALTAKGVEVWLLKQRRGRVDLRALLERLYEAGVRGLLVEGGAEVAGAFVDAQLVDKLFLFLAPKIFGGAAPSAVAGEGAKAIVDAARFERMQVEPVGEDLLLTAYAVRDAPGDVHGNRRGRGVGPSRRGRTGRR